MATRSTSAASTVLVSPTTVLRLRADVQPTAEATRRIQWTEDVVDNEHLGKRKSKRCCIFHKQKNFGEESSSSSSESEDSESDEHAGHDHNGDCADAHGHGNENDVGSAGDTPAPPSWRRRKRTGKDREQTPILNPTHCEHCRRLVEMETEAASRTIGGGGTSQPLRTQPQECQAGHTSHGPMDGGHDHMCGAEHGRAPMHSPPSAGLASGERESAPPPGRER